MVDGQVSGDRINSVWSARTRQLAVVVVELQTQGTNIIESFKTPPGLPRRTKGLYRTYVSPALRWSGSVRYCLAQRQKVGNRRGPHFAPQTLCTLDGNCGPPASCTGCLSTSCPRARKSVLNVCKRLRTKTSTPCRLLCTLRFHTRIRGRGWPRSHRDDPAVSSPHRAACPGRVQLGGRGGRLRRSAALR